MIDYTIIHECIVVIHHGLSTTFFTGRNHTSLTPTTTGRIKGCQLSGTAPLGSTAQNAHVFTTHAMYIHMKLYRFISINRICLRQVSCKKKVCVDTFFTFVLRELMDPPSWKLMWQIWLQELDLSQASSWLEPAHRTGGCSKLSYHGPPITWCGSTWAPLRKSSSAANFSNRKAPKLCHCFSHLIQYYMWNHLVSHCSEFSQHADTSKKCLWLLLWISPPLATVINQPSQI